MKVFIGAILVALFATTSSATIVDCITINGVNSRGESFQFVRIDTGKNKVTYVNVPKGSYLLDELINKKQVEFEIVKEKSKLFDAIRAEGKDDTDLDINIIFIKELSDGGWVGDLDFQDHTTKEIEGRPYPSISGDVFCTESKKN